MPGLKNNSLLKFCDAPFVVYECLATEIGILDAVTFYI